MNDNQVAGYLPLAGEHPAGHKGANAESKPIDGRASEREAKIDRLAWRCRRGLLELDLWLGGFLSASRATLQPDEAIAFERLLALSDMHILDLLHGRMPADDAAVHALVVCIHNYRAPNRDTGDE